MTLIEIADRIRGILAGDTREARNRLDALALELEIAHRRASEAAEAAVTR